MKAYLDLVDHVLKNGTRKPNRTGVDTWSTFGYYYEHDMEDGFPLLTTKQISWKNIVVENLWFLSGNPKIDLLKKHGCKFWDAWAEPDGSVPSAYGNFWRHFPVHKNQKVHLVNSDGAPVDTLPDSLNPTFNDQIAWVLNEMKKNPMSRRMVVSAWAPSNAQTSKLPPCHAMFLFNVQLGEDGEPRLCLHLTQRSCDVALGVPYNLAGYSFLLQLFAHLSGLKPGLFGHSLVDAHVYTAKADGAMGDFDHVPGLREQLRREPRPLPRMTIAPHVQSLGDIEELLKADTSTLLDVFRLDDYNPHPAIPFKVAV